MDIKYNNNKLMEEKIIEEAILDDEISSYGVELSQIEKVNIISNTFQEKDIKNTIKYPANFLAKQFKAIDGFDARWNSLITNNPLLFEDIDYLRVKQFIDSKITETEIKAYKDGKLTEMYATLENMLVCNIKYYDRIMSFATMIFMHYVKINDFNYTDKLKKIPIELEMTPTRLWCCALSGIKSTEWEINYAWAPREIIKDLENKNIVIHKKITVKPIEGSQKSIFEVSFNKLYKNPTFAKFVEYSATRCGTSGFQNTFLKDITSNDKLAYVCNKFTNTSAAMGENQLQTIIDYVDEVEIVNKRLYNSLKRCLMEAFNNDETMFNIWVFNNEFFIQTVKFAMKVTKDKGIISKDYLSNSYECFIAEEFLFKSVKEQMEWAKYIIPAKYKYDMNILVNLLHEMLKTNYKGVCCLKRMEDGVVSLINFTGIFGNVKMHECLIYEGKTLKTNEVVFSKKNMANLVIERGYFLMGTYEDIYTNFPTDAITKKHIINHYQKYCVPVLQHLSNVIFMHNNSKNEIIDILCKGTINPSLLNNKNILYTNLHDINNTELMSVSLKKQQERNSLTKKTLAQTIYG